MEIILSIIGLIMLVSFYDYFSARNWQQVTSSTRNDIVFESRNKEYGAYMIRKNYDKRMLIIFGGLILFVGVAYASLKISQMEGKEKEEEEKINQTQVKVKIAPVEIIIPPPVVPPPPKLEKLVAFLPPVVVDEVVDAPPVTQDDLDKGKISTVDQDGDPDAETGIGPQETPPAEVEVKEEIVAFVDEDPLYPGGMGEFAKFLAENIRYPETAIELGISGKCLVGFVVNKNGEVSDVRTLRGVTGCPECDKEAERVVRLMPKWTPGKVGGKPVKSRYQVPVNYKLAN